MFRVVGKPDVDKLDIDICRAYQEFCVTRDKMHCLFSNLTKVISIAAVGEYNNLFVGIFDGGANLVNV